MDSLVLANPRRYSARQVVQLKVLGRLKGLLSNNNWAYSFSDSGAESHRRVSPSHDHQIRVFPSFPIVVEIVSLLHLDHSC